MFRSNLSNENNKLELSIFSLYCLLFYLIFSLIFRFLLPFGDEPDFFVRAPRFILTDTHVSFSPYRLISDLVSSLNVVSSCYIQSSPLGLLSGIDATSCLQSTDQVLTRFLIMLLIISPLILFTIFRPEFIFSFVSKSIRREKLANRIDALSLSIIVSGFIYYFGVLGIEQYLLLLSIIFVTFSGSKIIQLFTLLMIVQIDLGDSIVVIFYALAYIGFNFTFKRFSIRTNFVLLISGCLFALLIKDNILNYTMQLSLIEEKSSDMIYKYEVMQVRDNYPTILRPIITFMSMILFTPAYVKSYMGILFAVGALICFMRGRTGKIALSRLNAEGEDIQEYSMFYAFMFTMLFLVFTFPDYANAKYYVFMLPALFSFLLLFVNKQKLLLSILLINFFVMLELSLGYLNYV